MLSTFPYTGLFMMMAVLVFAHTAETALGFGSTVIAMALGIYILPLETLLPVLVILGILQSLWLMMRWFRHIRWKMLFLKILPATAIGMVGGIYYRTQVASYAQLVILLGVFIMALSVIEIVFIFRTGAISGRLPWYFGYPILLAGGMVHGIFATGGPLIVYYASRELTEQSEFRASLAVLWLILNIALVFNLVSAGQLTPHTLAITAFILPGLIAGIVLGSFLKLKTLAFKIAVYALLFIAALLMLVRHLSSC